MKFFDCFLKIPSFKKRKPLGRGWQHRTIKQWCFFSWCLKITCSHILNQQPCGRQNDCISVTFSVLHTIPSTYNLKEEWFILVHCFTTWLDDCKTETEHQPGMVEKLLAHSDQEAEKERSRGGRHTLAGHIPVKDLLWPGPDFQLHIHQWTHQLINPQMSIMSRNLFLL